MTFYKSAESNLISGNEVVQLSSRYLVKKKRFVVTEPEPLPGQTFTSEKVAQAFRDMVKQVHSFFLQKCENRLHKFNYGPPDDITKDKFESYSG